MDGLQDLGLKGWKGFRERAAARISRTKTTTGRVALPQVFGVKGLGFRV